MGLCRYMISRSASLVCVHASSSRSSSFCFSPPSYKPWLVANEGCRKKNQNFKEKKEKKSLAMCEISLSYPFILEECPPARYPPSHSPPSPGSLIFTTSLVSPIDSKYSAMSGRA